MQEIQSYGKLILSEVFLKEIFISFSVCFRIDLLRKAKAAYIKFSGSKEKINHFLIMGYSKLYSCNENVLGLGLISSDSTYF